MLLMRMAWRNIWRNRRRTLVTTAAITFALFITLMYSGMVEGMLVNMERDTLDFEIGSVQVFATGYQDRPSIYASMADADAIVAKLADDGVPATARLLGAGLAASGEASAGVQLRGIDIARDAEVLALNEQMFAGEWLAEDDPHGVVLGRRLAGTLAVQPGAELVVLSQAADGSIANDLYRVRGVLRSVGEATDRAGVFMTTAAFRELMSFYDGAQQIIVRRPAGIPLEKLAATVSAAAPKHDVQTWKQLIPALATMLQSTRGLVMFVFFIFYVVVGIVVLNAMLMAVFERIREFGVLKALGIGPGKLLRLIYLESFLQVGLAIVVALLASAPVLWYLVTTGINMGSLAGVSMMGMAMMSHWKAVVGAQTFSGPIFMLVFVVGLAALYPAVKAALIRPVEAMRHQ